jgi:RND family efflux transporter MFP subunit
MATQRPGFAVPLAEFAAGLLSEREVVPRARITAHQVAEMLPGTGVVVYVVMDQEAPAWTAKAAEGEIEVAESVVGFEAGTLGTIAERKEACIFPGGELTREQTSHLNVRRTVVSLACVPILLEEMLLGAIEIVNYDRPVSESELAQVAEVAEYAALGLATALAYESERNTQLESISRIAQMYDLEKVFNSSLEMDQLLPMITSKFREVINVQAVNLWLVEGDGLVLMSRTGVDPAYEEGARQKAGEGIAAQVSDSGEAVVIESAEDERLQRRNRDVEEGQAFSLLAAPVLHGGALVGVVEAINKLDGTPFDDDDQFLLTTINETASNALHNASLLLAERKVEILETLVQVSKEITSTLNLERVLQAVVTGPSAVIPYERASIALEERNKIQVKAISGMTEINSSDPDVKRLSDLLQWASLSTQEMFIVQKDGEIDDPRPETREKFKRYFEESGMRAFYVLPLADDQGRVGMLAFESSDPDFLSEAHLEMIKVLAGQATVAIRNASLYREVPFIGILEPFLQKKQQFLALEQRRRRAMVLGAGITLLALIVVPWPMRVDGVASVAAAHMAKIQPEVEGVVAKVNVREGDPVTRGTVLADLEDWDYRGAFAAAEAKRSEAVALMNRALASNDGSEAGVQRVQADYWTAEAERARARLERTHLRSPIDGVVATPRVEDLVGRHLEYGDTFAEVADTRRATVDVTIADSDVALLEPGEAAVVKLDAFPTHTFRGKLEVISPLSQVEEEHRVFFARVTVANDDPDAQMRPGMQGRGKVDVRTGWYRAGWRPLGYVLFRSTAMWFRSKMWAWFGL